MRPASHVQVVDGDRRWWLCECDSWTCRQRIELTTGEALDLRARFPHGYVVAPGHVAAGERVLVATPAYFVVDAAAAAA